MAAGTAVIDIQRRQYVLMDARPALRRLPRRLNGLLDIAEGYVTVLTGTQEGPLRLTVETHDGAPPLELDGWDEVVELSQFSPSGQVTVCELMGDSSEGLPQLRLPPNSWFRVRCHARGRDEAMKHGIVPRALEEHKLHLWPAAAADDICHRLTDHFGEIMRSQWGESSQRSSRGSGPEPLL